MSDAFSVVDWGLLRAFADHLWQSTIGVIVAAVLVWLLRGNHARVHFWIWFAASVKFLVPFSILIAFGEAVEWRSAPAPLSSAAFSYAVMDVVSQPFSSSRTAFAAVPTLSPGPARAAISRAPALLLALWACGTLALAAYWVARWRRIARIVRTSARASAGPLVEAVRRICASTGIATPVRVAITDATIEPGIFGFVTPTLVWPRALSEHLDEQQTDAILLHELCHARRGDNATAALHMVVEAVFWFHPLVWWLGSRLVDARERACDEEVLRLGSSAGTYAEGILKTCQFCLDSKLTCVSGVTGSDLKKRIEAIMRYKLTAGLSPLKKTAVATVCVAAIAGPIALGAVSGQLHDTVQPVVTLTNTIDVVLPLETTPPRAVTPIASASTALPAVAPVMPLSPQAITSPPQTQLAPVQASQTIVLGPGVIRISSRTASDRTWFNLVTAPEVGDGLITASGVTLRELIGFAYAGPTGALMRSQVVGGPPWADTTRFDVMVAVPPGKGEGLIYDSDAVVTGGSGLPVLQRLIADRFGLVVHPEVRSLPVYDLVTVSGGAGADLKRSTASCAGGADPAQRCQFTSGPGFVVSQGRSMRYLAVQLGWNFPAVNRPVRDRTGLQGTYDFTISFVPTFLTAPNRAAPDVPNPAATAGTSLFQAIESRLGLRLVDRMDTLDVMVIDSVRALTN